MGILLAFLWEGEQPDFSFLYIPEGAGIPELYAEMAKYRVTEDVRVGGLSRFPPEVKDILQATLVADPAKRIGLEGLKPLAKKLVEKYAKKEDLANLDKNPIRLGVRKPAP